MPFGLNDTIIERIQKVFEGNSKVDEVIVFGSRAKGNYRPDSDIDFALKGRDISFDDILTLSGKLDELNLPYKIDLVDYVNIKEKDLVEHIDRVGVVFFSKYKETEIGRIPTNWEIVEFDKICELITDGSHYSPAPKASGKFMASVKDMRYNHFDFTDCKKISNKDFDLLVVNKCDPKNGDILLSKDGANCLDLIFVYKQPEHIVILSSIAIARLKKLYYPDFYRYFLLSPNVQFLMRNHFISGSAIPRVVLKDFKKVPVLVIPYEEQISIASILISLDDKIELLHRQNKTLEQLAETLFRQWFVEEAEESWEVKPLGKVFDIGIGRTPPRKEQHWFTTNPDDIKWISIKDMGASGVYIDTVSEYLTQEAIERYSVPVIPENTVVLSFKMTIGRLAITTEKMVSNEAIAHFKQIEGSYLFPEFLYLFLKTYSWQELGSTSSIVESINSQMIKEMEMVIPDEKRLTVFKNLTKPDFDKIRSNQIQIRNLTQLRDTLLPKLMSGEVRVEI